MKPPARVCEDCDEKVLTFAEIQAAASGRPEIKQRIDAGSKLAELESIKRDYELETSRANLKIETLPQTIETLKERLEMAKNDTEKSQKINEITVNGKREKSAETEIFKVIEKAIINFKNDVDDPLKLGNICGFNIEVKPFLHNLSRGIQCKFIVKGELEYQGDAGITENSQNLTRLENLLTKVIPKQTGYIEQKIFECENDLVQAKERVDKPFERENELVEVKAKIVELDLILSDISSVKDEDTVISDGEQIAETLSENAERKAIYENTDDKDFQPVPEEPTNNFRKQ
jgi:hypothetical protein